MHQTLSLVNFFLHWLWWSLQFMEWLFKKKIKIKFSVSFCKLVSLLPLNLEASQLNWKKGGNDSRIFHHLKWGRERGGSTEKESFLSHYTFLVFTVSDILPHLGPFILNFLRVVPSLPTKQSIMPYSVSLH